MAVRYRARRAGDAHEVERKLEKRYDEEEALGTQARIVDWLNRTLNGQVEPCKATNFQAIHTYLFNGVVLCKLMNKLLASEGMPTIGYRSKANSAFVAMNNIENFCNAARAYGVPGTSLFETTDLYEGRKGTLVNVINCLNQLGFSANSKGFQPRYEGVDAPKADWLKDEEEAINDANMVNHR